MIYFDNSATTKPCPEAVKAITDALTENWGNPSSAHFAGDSAHRAVEEARKAVASALGIRRAADGRVIFTSGGTEANNLAIFGAVYAKERPVKNGRRGTVIITDGEHASVEVCADALEKDGFRIVRIPTVGGKLDLDFLKKEATSDVISASLMLVNNETGAVYDVKNASKIIKAVSPAAVIHSDCVQAFMKMRFAPSDIGADMISVSAHKVYSAKGAGALYVSKDIITAKKIIPTLYGGGQEENYRSGTEGVPQVLGFGAAVKAISGKVSERKAYVAELRDYVMEKLAKISGVKLNIPEKSLPYILSITVPNIKSETLLNYLSGEGICVSKSSACSTNHRNLSRALMAFGLSETDTDSTLRLSFSADNTKEEVDVFCEVLAKGIATLAQIKKL